jgi:hypothetical protein
MYLFVLHAGSAECGIELISIHSLTNHSQKNWEIFYKEKSTALWRNQNFTTPNQLKRNR